MATPKDPAELALVRLAIHNAGVTGCCEWAVKAVRPMRDYPPRVGLSPEVIRSLLVHYVENQAGEIIQVVETREEYSDRSFYYKAIIPDEQFLGGLFVEMILVDGDPDLPSIALVNAHEQR